MSEMVERAARAMREVLYTLNPHRPVMLSDDEAAAAARAAIATMRVPTEEMMRALCHRMGISPDKDWRNKGEVFLSVADPQPAMWRHMARHWGAAIDTALAPAAEGTGTGEMEEKT